MLSLYDEPRCRQGEDVHNSDQTPLRSHVEDCDADCQETRGKN